MVGTEVKVEMSSRDSDFLPFELLFTSTHILNTPVSMSDDSLLRCYGCSNTTIPDDKQVA